jgi:hypothetical protein
VLAAALALAAAACGDRPGGDGGPAAAAAPAVEFLVAAGDSTYWFASGPHGMRVRASPLFLARWGRRLAEVYVADDERAFDDGAWFAAQRVYRRDLLTGDSALVFADAAVPRLAARHAARHPDARLLDADERDDAAASAGDDDPQPGASSTVALAAAHGPYLSLEHHTDVVADGTEQADAADDPPAEVVRRRVIDLRTGREVVLADLFGPAAAARLDSAGRWALDSAVTALRPAARRAVRAAARRRASGDDEGLPPADAARRALVSLRTLAFDPQNFGLAARAGRPAVVFVAVGHDADGSVVTLALPPVVVAGPAPAWWRRDVEPTLFAGPGADAPAAAPGTPDAAGAFGPSGSPDTAVAAIARWRAAGSPYEVRARVAAGAAALELVPVGAAPGRAAGAPSGAAAGSPAARRATPLARVPAPLLQLIRLDAPDVPAAARRALRRAFDESAFYDAATTSAAWAPAPAPGVRPPRRPGRA